MICPEVDQIVEHDLADTFAEEVKEHIRKCPDCQANLETLQILREALRPDVSVPPAAIRRVMLSLPELEGGSGRWITIPSHPAFGGFLGALTGLTALWASGSIAGGGPVLSLLFPLLVGGLSVMLQARKRRGL